MNKEIKQIEKHAIEIATSDKTRDSFQTYTTYLKKKFKLDKSLREQNILLEKLSSFKLEIGVLTNNVIESSHNMVPKNVIFQKHFRWVQQISTESRMNWTNRFLGPRRKRRRPPETNLKNSALKTNKDQYLLKIISFDEYWFNVRKICDKYRKTTRKKKKEKNKKEGGGGEERRIGK